MKEQNSLLEERNKLKEELQAAVSEKEAKQIELESLKKTVSTKDREIEELRKKCQYIKMKSDCSAQNAVSVPKNVILEWNEKNPVKSIYTMLRGAACAGGTMAYFNPGGVGDIQRRFDRVKRLAIAAR